MVQVRRNLFVFFQAVQQFPSASTCSCSSMVEEALLLPNISQQSTKNQQNLMFIIKVSSLGAGMQPENNLIYIIDYFDNL